MRHQAIYDLYSNVVTINGDGNDCIAYDENGAVVDLNSNAISTKEAELVAANDLALLRQERNKRLFETDFWAMSDTTDMTSEQITYRQALRDITKTATSLDDVTWPSKP